MCECVCVCEYMCVCVCVCVCVRERERERERERQRDRQTDRQTQTERVRDICSWLCWCRQVSQHRLPLFRGCMHITQVRNPHHVSCVHQLSQTAPHLSFKVIGEPCLSLPSNVSPPLCMHVHTLYIGGHCLAAIVFVGK